MNYLSFLIGILSLLVSVYGLNSENYILLIVFSVITIISFILGIILQKNTGMLTQKEKEFFNKDGLITVHFPRVFKKPPNVIIIKEFGWEYSWRIEEVSEEKFKIKVNKLASTSGSRNGRMGFIWKAKGKKH